MKRITILIIVVFIYTTGVFSQEVSFPIDSITGKVTYSEVVTVENKTQAELYISAREWFVNNFRSSQNVIQLDDKEAGIIMGKGNIPVSTTVVIKESAGNVHFTIKVELREGRFKYTLTDFEHEQGGSKYASCGDILESKPKGGLMGLGKKNWDGVKEQTNTTVLAMIEDLKIAMSSVTKVDEW